MTWSVRAFAGTLLSIVAIVSTALHADTVQLSLRDGRLSLVATNATPAQIFAAWSRAGGVLIVNAEQMPSVPVSIRLDNVPEEQALDTLLRPVSGYLAVRRTDPAGSGSIFDRIVILATAQAARQSSPASPAGTFAAPPSPQQPGAQPASVAAPQGIPQGPGVTRLVGPDGQPVEDDQAGAPTPAYNPGDPPDTRQRGPRGAPVPVPVPVQPQQAPQPQQPNSTSAPAGAPRPGMVVPAPQTPQQQQQPPQR